MPRRAQVFLAAVIATSIVGTMIASSPPHPTEESISKKGDAIYFFAIGFVRMLFLAPLVLLALHTCSLAYFFPAIPRAIYGYGAENRLNTDLITWSAATSIPLILIFGVGIPFRLVSFAWLGKNFTFALKEPDHLITDGVYRYLQHPSYLGAIVLNYCNSILLLRIDGALSCWIPPQWYPITKKIWRWYVAPLWFSFTIFIIWTRVNQEESMLLATFGTQWENWHASTARFIPGIF